MRAASPLVVFFVIVSKQQRVATGSGEQVRAVALLCSKVMGEATTQPTTVFLLLVVIIPKGVMASFSTSGKQRAVCGRVFGYES